ncbi:hypothetical protein [Microbispora triticiradicis]|uniref:Uncharacterized protein n=2 Tax=Microbispora TaxID=2005 RepID=A0ABY3M4M1_9ACTN|nr:MULTISPECIES: hypothetical protein [Microbispora]TLP57023.1 hypothetical protein FED44_21665 [Microbispora fusca]TYB66979.1 hypothetical protein FXF59_04105 [Microbispora tritici]
MTVMRRGSLRRRSMTLVAAMIAPSILASGLLVADLAGYGEHTRSSLADEAKGVPTDPVGGVRSAGPGLSAEAPSGARPFADTGRAAQTAETVLDPTPVPEPYGPARRYEGLVRLPAVPAPVVGRVWKAVPRSAPEKEKRRPIKEPREERPACAPEWEGTWLWDACREGGGQ